MNHRSLFPPSPSKALSNYRQREGARRGATSGFQSVFCRRGPFASLLEFSCSRCDPALSEACSRVSLRRIHGSPAGASQLHLRRLWRGEHVEAWRRDPMPGVWLSHSVQEAHTQDCPIRSTLKPGTSFGSIITLVYAVPTRWVVESRGCLMEELC